MIDEIPGGLLQWLRGFYFVAEKGSVTQAATAMGRGQPAITYQIKSLEKELGVTLFDRSSGKMTLTAEGRGALESVISLFEDLKEIRSSPGKKQLDYEGKIVIAANLSTINSFLPRYVSLFMNRYPRVSFHMEAGVYDAVIEKVESGKADFGIAFVDSVPRTMAYHDLFEAGEKLIVPKSKRFFRGGPPTLRQIAQVPLILFSVTGSIDPSIERRFAEEGLHPRIVMTHNNSVSVKRYVAQGLGVAIMSGSTVSEEDGKRFDVFPLDRYFPKRKYGLLLRKKKYLPPVVKAFIRTIKPNIHFKKQRS
jgi:DNA-binding transcriptional LysR family regulator